MLWHIPLDVSGNVARNWLFYLQIRVLFAIPMALIFTWLYNRSAGNLLSVAIFHAGMNTFPFVLPYSPPTLGLMILFAVCVVFSDRMWRFRLPTIPGAPKSLRT